jgi:formylglycine-generating enzyme required for sulfatase activity
MKDLLTNHFNLPYLDLVKVKAGTFMMGSQNDDKEAAYDEKPCHPVIIEQDFWMMAYPVSQAFWEAVMGENPSEFKDPNRPVEQVSWDAIRQADGFLERINKQFKLNSGETQFFRLPSEAQWEYAARGGPFWKEGYLYSGSDMLESHGYFEENTQDEGSECIGLKAPNALGLYDMSGQVWEWCEDDWHSDYSNNAPKTEDAWVDSPNRGDNRVLRGGSWYDSRGSARVASRDGLNPDNTWDNQGFRLVFV